MAIKYNNFFKKQFCSFLDFEKNLSLINNDKLKGDIFEEFVKIYFELNKELYQIKNIYLLKEIPIELKRQLKLEKTDYGVDAVAEREDGEFVVFQVKFRSNREGLTHRELSTFVTEGGTAKYKYIISNCYDIPISIKKHENIYPILFDTFQNLDRAFFHSVFELVSKNKTIKLIYFPKKHQIRAIKNITAGLKKSDRGKYISACGTGKTLTAMWVMEELTPKNVLFLVPSLALIKQTLESWSRNTKIKFNYLCVCSDKSVSDIDSENIDIQEIGVPVTTKKEEIIAFIKDNREYTKIIFSTYQSLNEIKNSVNTIDKFEFDIIFFDEAHRTAGIKQESLFNLAVDNDLIKSKKRLFMTATERILNPKLKTKLTEADRIVFSMDDVTKYGPTFERLSFGEAISLGIISDYKVIISAIKDKEISDLITNNNFIKIIQDEKERKTTAINLFKQLMLVRAMAKYNLKKTIVFNADINSSKSFISRWSTNLDLNLELKKELKLNNSELSLEHIDGTMNTGERTKLFNSFENHKIGIISNAKCLTEGVDIPIIDSIYFAAPKTSVIDIVQACGRALRKNGNSKEKIAYIIVPIFYDENKRLNEGYFDNLYYIVQALRDQDERLADYIDKLNFNLAQGKPSTISNKRDSPIEIIISKDIDLNKFKFAINLKIAEHNSKNITEKKYDALTKNKGYLKSGYVRIFKTIGDYKTAGYKSLVDKTINKFNNTDQILNVNQLKIDHNNISHTRRLRLIEQIDKKYKLTKLGKDYYNKSIPFDDVFKKIMLSENNITEYPYITVLKILIKVKTINFLQFLYGIYTLKDETNDSIDNAITTIKELQNFNYNILIAKKENRIKILEQLNKRYEANFNDIDLIMKNTSGNQFRYLGDHLSLFKENIEYNTNEKIISIKSYNNLKEVIKY